MAINGANYQTYLRQSYQKRSYSGVRSMISPIAFARQPRISQIIKYIAVIKCCDIISQIYDIKFFEAF
jgi:hypothetical protein